MHAKHIPLALTALRAALAPCLIALAIYWPTAMAMGTCLVLAFLSDVFDGIIARRLHVASPTLRRLDSVADSVFYLAAIFAACWLYPAEVRAHRPSLALLCALEVTRYIYDFLKFKREAAYHMWSSKLWGIFLLTGFLSLLCFGQGGWPLSLAIYMGIIADLEGLAISASLNTWQTDIPTLFHALRARG